MTMHLRPCSGCSRHVRVGDAACPFCGATLGTKSAKNPAPTAVARLSRAALFAAGTAGAAAASLGCGTAQPAYGGVIGVPLYGGFFPQDASMDQEAGMAAPDSSDTKPDADATPDSGPTKDEDAPSVVALYGAFMPPSDADVKTD